MVRQYYASRFRPSTEPRDRRVGTIPVGSIIYIQDEINPLRGFLREVICSVPWIVEA